MNAPADPKSSPLPSPVARPIRWGTIRNLEVVLAVAFTLATLFTAWTPGHVYDLSQRANIQRPQVANPIPQPTPLSPGQPTRTPRARPLIGIVAGHWGNQEDSGAVCDDGLTEVSLNQQIATLVQKNLVAQGFDVDLLKEFDPRLVGYQASALVSVHNDSCYYINDQATGFKVASAMFSPYPERSARLAACLRSRYSQATGLPLHSTSVTRDMTDYHAFNEIDPETTAVIIETGFLNLDRQFLTQHTDQVALGITEGILCFIHEEDIATPVKATPTVISTTLSLTQTVPVSPQPMP